MRVYKLERIFDDSGVSGTGDIARAIDFEDGCCILHWRTGQIRTTTIFHDIKEVEIIHGHNGHTKIVEIGFID